MSTRRAQGSDSTASSTFQPQGFEVQEKKVWDGFSVKRFEPNQAKLSFTALVGKVKVAFYQATHDKVSIDNKDWYMSKKDRGQFELYKQLAPLALAKGEKLEDLKFSHDFQTTFGPTTEEFIQNRMATPAARTPSPPPLTPLPAEASVKPEDLAANLPLPKLPRAPPPARAPPPPPLKPPPQAAETPINTSGVAPTPPPPRIPRSSASHFPPPPPPLVQLATASFEEAVAAATAKGPGALADFHENNLKLSLAGMRLDESVVIAAATYLSTLNAGKGFLSDALEVTAGWRGSANKISVILRKEVKILGEGSFGKVAEHKALIVQAGKKTVNAKNVARKTYKDKATFERAREGNKLGETRFNQALAQGRKLIGIAKPYTNFNEDTLTADMKGYIGDLSVWKERNQGHSLEDVVSCFVPAFQAVEDLQRDGLLHTDIKWGNMVSTADENEFHHIDTEDAVPTANLNDPRPLEEIQKEFNSSFPPGKSMLTLTMPYTPYALFYEAQSRINKLNSGTVTDKAEFLKTLQEIREAVASIQTFQMGAALFEVATGLPIYGKDFTTNSLTFVPDQAGFPLTTDGAAIHESILKAGNYTEASKETADVVAKLLTIPPTISIAHAKMELKRISSSAKGTI